MGLIPLADQGTFFLDEIGDMPVPLQAKLLKVLETGEVYPLGDTKPRIIDIRIISATNADIDNKISAGKFREDLYWRLNVIEIKVPPLRERKDDIELLCRHYIAKFAGEHKKNISGIDNQALAVLLDYAWPGNVRELSNTMERSVVLADGKLITLCDLPEKLIKADHKQETSLLRVYLADYEKNMILKAYANNNKNKDETARALGVDLATLYRKFKKYCIETE